MLLTEIYDREPAGGHGHIVFDDWNLGDGSIDWCLNDADRFHEMPDTAALIDEALCGLRWYPEADRYAILARWSQFYGAEPR